MNQIKEKLTKISIITGIAVIVFIIICIPLSSDEITKLYISYSPQTEEQLTWYYVEQDRNVTLPLPVSGEGYDSVTLEKILPEEIPDDYSILFNTCNSIISVSIDDNEIFSVGKNGGTIFGQMLTDLKCIVPIQRSYAGHKLTVVTTPVVKYSGRIPVIYFRCQADQIRSLIFDNLWCVIICTILAVMCFYSLGLGISHKRHNISQGQNRLFNYAVFSFTVILYLITNSDIPQLISNYNEVNVLINYLTLAYGTVPLMGIYIELVPAYKKQFSVIQFAGCIVTLLNILLYVTGICLPSQLLPLTHILYIFLAVTLVYISIRGQSSRRMTLLNIGNACLILIGLGSLFIYYLFPDKDWNTIVLALSVLFFSIFLILEMISMESQALKEATEKATENRIAFIDPLTKLANRSALFNYANDLMKLPPATQLIVMTIDIDNLKVINEQLGNIAGDILLQKAAECLTRAFESSGTVYRYEGDEFVAIIVNPTDSIIDYEDRLKNAVLVNNRVTPYKLSLSVGSALTEIGAADSNFLYKLLEKAEEKMQHTQITF